MELKPCPFCGSKAEIKETATEIKTKGESSARNVVFVRHIRGRYGQISFHVYKQIKYTPICTNTSCICRLSKQFWTTEEAIKAWNVRKE